MDNIEGFLRKKEFLKILNENISKFSGKDKNIFLIYLDIDDFFLINANYGFEIGDLIIKDFARYLKEEFKNFDILWGWLYNDQFLIALFNLSYIKFLDFIEKFLGKIKQYNFVINKHNIKLTASLGVAVYPYNGKTGEELLKAAAIALKSAKLEGKNTWKFFEPECEVRVKNVEKIRNLLEYGINHDKIVPYIQPIFETKTQKVIGGEILLRILQENGEVVNAGTFIDIAEQMGYINDLEKIIFAKIIEEKFLKIFSQKFLFINKTVKSVKKIITMFEDLETLDRLAKDFNFYPVIEITENSLINFLDVFKLLNRELKNKKVKLAIDDFGAGYASFSFLLKIEASFLKIDGSIVKKITFSPKHMAIIKGIAFLSKEIGLKTVAEFVENKEQLDILKDLGIDYVQGFFLSKPLSFEEFKSFIKF